MMLFSLIDEELCVPKTHCMLLRCVAEISPPSGGCRYTGSRSGFGVNLRCNRCPFISTLVVVVASWRIRKGKCHSHL